MRIVYIIPGPAGPLFEKNSLREQGLVAELRWDGHDVLFVPILFPLGSGTPVSLPSEAEPLLVGAVRVYARQSMPALARHAPEWFWRLVDKPLVRKFVAKRVMATPKRFSDFMKDVLDGRNGALVAEINKLCEWLKAHQKPDIIYLSTPFLLGIAPMLKRALRVPVACAMNSELEEISHLQGPDAIILLTKLRSAVPDADGFIPVSNYHSQRIHRRLGIATSATRFVHPGIYIDNIPPTPPPDVSSIGILVREGGKPSTISPATVVTALSKNKSSRGIPIRVAFETSLMRKSGKKRKSRKDQKIRSIIDAGGSVETLPQDEEELHAFLGTHDIIIFIHPEQCPAFDYAIIEALACSVPVLLPDNGANSEIAGLSNAVFLYSDVNKILTVVAKVMAMPGEAKASLRAKARYSVEHCFSMPRMARETADALQGIINRNSPPPESWPLRTSN
ncbi:MAG: glycosyltransferase family 4 protein [Lentisphaerae bacterium]|nr:glycosyltransferase family 4 protein [Lentisphaerota bacterium]